MQPDYVSRRLNDILAAIALIFGFTRGMTFAEYSHDSLATSAVERQFITIGEAVNALSHINTAAAYRITDYRGVIEFRNHLAHRYYDVDNIVVWRIVNYYLPVLNREVSELLREFEES